jgi:hypothetical protein
MKAAAAGQSNTRGVNRFGIVTSTRQTDTGYDVKVLYDYGPDSQAQSGWIPVLSHMVGPGWGAVSPPHEGMLAFVAPDMGDGNHGVVIGLSWNSTDKAPLAPQQMDGDSKPVVAGELCFVSKAGAVLRLCADGSIYMKGPVVIEGQLTVKNDIISTTGNITAQKGDVSDQHGSLNRLRGNYDQHQHADPQGGQVGLTTKND